MHSHFSSPKIQFDLLFFVTIIKLPCINFFSKFRCNKEILQLYNKFSSRLKHYLVWFNYSNQKFLRKILKILNSCRYAFWKERCHISSNLISFALCRSKVEQYTVHQYFRILNFDTFERMRSAFALWTQTRSRRFWKSWTRMHSSLNAAFICVHNALKKVATVSPQNRS